MPDAARVGDPATGPHGVGLIIPPAAMSVAANARPRARTADPLQCACGLPDFIVTGVNGVFIASPVFVSAAVGSKTMHGGTVTTGSANVEVDGPWTGVTLGNVAAGTAAFNALAAGRNPAPGTSPIAGHTLQQNYNNCGIESSRQIINRATHGNVSQEALLHQALTNGWATKQATLFQSGGSVPSGRVHLLESNGVDAHEAPPDMEHLQQAVAERRGVTADVWAAKLWPPDVAQASGLAPGSNAGGHTIVVTGVSYDAAGQTQSVVINDTGLGNGGRSIPAAQFQQMLIGGGNSYVVTDKPIW